MKDKDKMINVTVCIPKEIKEKICFSFRIFLLSYSQEFGFTMLHQLVQYLELFKL